jgi:hypothetical protein
VFTDNHDHPDSFRFADLNGDGKPEIISSFSDIGVVAFDASSGELPLAGNPDFAKGDWRGDGTTALFWFTFRIGADGKGTPYFAEPVYHMFDFTGQGADEVITLKNEMLRVYGCKDAIHKQAVQRDSEYLRNKVANHTHY